MLFDFTTLSEGEYVDDPPRSSSTALTSLAFVEDLGLSRRQLLRFATLVTGGGLAGLAGLSLAGCTKEQIEKIKNRPIRREITTVAAQKDVESYKKAITAMKALDGTPDLRSWQHQSDIHLNLCRHASWLFFPWHRAYLFYFEQICRELSNDATFALPYWNWTANPQIPAAFWQAGSPLLHSPRAATASSVASSLAVGSTVVNPMLDEPNFLVFAGPATSLNDTSQFGPGYGLVEQTPHNYIHGFVGGTMGTFSSPLDPIFWTHHNRVDELWMEWNILKDHPNTNDSAWTNTSFVNEFCDGHGTPVTVSVLATILMPLLSYQFDTQVTP
jgi:tyrosinase